MRRLRCGAFLWGVLRSMGRCGAGWLQPTWYTELVTDGCWPPSLPPSCHPAQIAHETARCASACSMWAASAGSHAKPCACLNFSNISSMPVPR